MAVPNSPATSAAGPRPGAELISRRHSEWTEHQLRWRFLLDSLEGGERYRQASYGTDRRGCPVRNLVRHKREYPDPREVSGVFAAPGGGLALLGADPAAVATDDDYELRRARTPVPSILAEAIDDHLSRIAAREVDRDGPAALKTWWDDVDGAGSTIDQWMGEVAAGPLLACGQVDFALDHPRAPAGAEVASRADAERLGLTKCVARVILPENLVWWRLDGAGRYAEALVREFPDGDDLNGLALGGPSGAFASVSPAAAAALAGGPSAVSFRHWTAVGWVLYDAEGREAGRGSHTFGRVPIVRVFTRRKARCGNVGQSDYEPIAELQREFYNRDSELVLSDTQQAHPLLQGPEDFIQADGSIPIGPNWLLPKKRNSNGGAATYEGFEVVDFPKGAAESIRLNKNDMRDEADRIAAMAKPAGHNGAGVVSQSGISKGFDSEKLNNKLSRLADALARAERQLAEMALRVLSDGEPAPADVAKIKVSYSKQFALTDVEDLGSYTARFLELIAAPAAGLAPEITAAYLSVMVRQGLPGRDDATYLKWDREIEAAVAKAKALADAPIVAAPALDLTASTAPSQAAMPTQTPLDPKAAAKPPTAPAPSTGAK